MGNVLKRRDLVGGEIVPGLIFVVNDGEVCVSGSLNHVLIEIVDRTQIAEVPVEGSAILAGSGGNCRHDDIAAIARIAGDDEAPGFSGPVVEALAGCAGYGGADACGFALAKAIATHD